MTEVKKRKLAVVGVSERTEKYGNRIFRDLVAAGYDVEGVNPRGGEVAGKKIFAQLKDVAPLPEMVITVVMPQITEQIVDQCIALGIKEIWMQPGSESSAAIEKAERAGMNVTHDSCFMVQKGIW